MTLIVIIWHLFKFTNTMQNCYHSFLLRDFHRLGSPPQFQRNYKQLHWRHKSNPFRRWLSFRLCSDPHRCRHSQAAHGQKRAFTRLCRFQRYSGDLRFFPSKPNKLQRRLRRAPHRARIVRGADCISLAVHVVLPRPTGRATGARGRRKRVAGRRSKWPTARLRSRCQRYAQLNIYAFLTFHWALGNDFRNEILILCFLILITHFDLFGLKQTRLKRLSNEKITCTIFHNVILFPNNDVQPRVT